MLLLFLSLVLGTPQGQGQFQTANLGVKVTCDNALVPKDQQVTLCCTVDYTAIQTPNHGMEGTSNDTTCVTKWCAWKRSNDVLFNCVNNSHMKEMEAPLRHYCYKKENVTKADEGNYTFSIGTDCGVDSGTASVFIVAVTAKSVDNRRDQQLRLFLVVIIIVIAVPGVLLFLKTSRSGRGLMERLKSSMTQSNNNTDESPEGSREAVTLVSA